MKAMITTARGLPIFEATGGTLADAVRALATAIVKRYTETGHTHFRSASVKMLASQGGSPLNGVVAYAIEHDYQFTIKRG